MESIESPTLRLFYWKNKVNQLALEVSCTVDASLYRDLIESCALRIHKEYIQNAYNPDEVHESYFKVEVPEMYNRLFIINSNKDSAEIQFLIHELDKRCDLEKMYMAEEPKKKTRKRRTTKKKEDKTNE